ncbi:MAG: polysaccharide lyase family 8 super-sandwich domain-containing protein [Eubacteriales bacterium]|nr:polysaccharide lyase family 8 super-sandwich domain-containing protein [Eubacteriales bacterium]
MRKTVALILTFLIFCSLFNTVYSESENYARNISVDVRFYNAEGELMISSTQGVRNITDANVQSGYSSPVGAQRADYILDLYEHRYINRVYLQELYSAINSYTISVSGNKSGWKTVYTGKGIGAYGRHIHFEPVRTRYVRLEVHETNNTYKDAIITLNEWQVYHDNTVIRDDLSNMIYIAENKSKSIVSEGVRHHFTDGDFEALNRQIEKARDVLSNVQASQQEIDSARDSLEEIIYQIDAKMVPGEADYDYLRKKYNDSMTGNHLEKTPSRLKTIENVHSEAKQWRETMLRHPNAKELWQDLIPPRANTQQESGKIGDAFTRIRRMALAYAQEGNAYYRSEELLEDIHFALDFMIKNKYNPGIEEYSNWYPWEVSAPAAISDILLLIGSDLDPELVQRIRQSVEFYVDQQFHYTWAGANRLYLSASSLKMGVALKDPFYIHRARYALAQEGKYNIQQKLLGGGENDGYYWDGSYIFHSGYMYNATYGRDQLSNTSNIIGMLVGTVWQIEQNIIDDLAKRIVDGYESIIYKGNTVDVASGRGLGSGASYGRTIANSIASISEYLPEPYRTNFQSMAKQMKLDQEVKDSLTTDEQVIPRGDITLLKRYPIGDKLIYHSPEFGFGLSMFSKRTRTFEAPNGDAMKAWYASSGMTYYLTDDKDQYDRNFWVAVDHYRLPGTTVDRIPRTTTRYEGEMYSTRDWVSSIDHENKYGAAGMEIANWNSSLYGKKSWFLFGDEIVNIGSGIQGGSETIETTVDNRKKTSENNSLTIGGKALEKGAPVAFQNTKTAHYSGDGKGDIGYYFIDNPTINAVLESRTEKVADMWFSDTTETVTEEFFTMWYDHGKNPKDGKYAYVTLMGYSQEETENYAENPKIEILAQNDEVHAVRHKELKVTGYNIWSKSGATAGGVSADGRLNMIVREDEEQIEITMTDPTFVATKPVTVTFDTNVTTIVKQDDAVKVISTSPLKIEVDLKNINGRGISLKALKTETDLTAAMISNMQNAIVLSTHSGSYIFGNIKKTSDAKAWAEGEVLWVPAKTVAQHMGSRYSFSEELGAFEIIGDEVLRVTDKGEVFVNGEKQEFEGAAFKIKDGILYAPCDLLTWFYKANSRFGDGILIFNTQFPIRDNEADAYTNAVRKRLGIGINQ